MEREREEKLHFKILGCNVTVINTQILRFMKS